MTLKSLLIEDSLPSFPLPLTSCINQLSCALFHILGLSVSLWHHLKYCSFLCISYKWNLAPEVWLDSGSTFWQEYTASAIPSQLSGCSTSRDAKIDQLAPLFFNFTFYSEHLSISAHIECPRSLWWLHRSHWVKTLGENNKVIIPLKRILHVSIYL